MNQNDLRITPIQCSSHAITPISDANIKSKWQKESSEGDWTDHLSVTFNTGQSAFFPIIGGRW